MTESIFLSLGGESFTWVGKAAPPSPTRPAALILSRISFTERSSGSLGGSGFTHSSFPSEVITRASISCAVGGFTIIVVPVISPDIVA
ncbi:hypothetical protein ES703_100797 [subsurface metagenome]